MKARTSIPVIVCAFAMSAASPALGEELEADGITSETMHKIYGATIVGVSTTLLLEDVGAFDAPQLRYAVPTLAITAGAFLTIDPLLHGSAAPSNYGAETRQHLVMGGLLMTLGSVDLAHEAAWLDHWSWGLALPAGLLASGASFFFHAQHGSPAQHELLTVQHRMLGVTIAVAAVSKALAAVPATDGSNEARWPQFETAWMIAGGLAGFQLLLYSEGRREPSSSPAHHALSVGWTGRGVSVMGSF